MTDYSEDFSSLKTRFFIVVSFVFFIFLIIFGAFGYVAYQAQFWLTEPDIRMGYMKKVDGVKMFPELHADLLLSLNITNPNWLKLKVRNIRSHIYYKHKSDDGKKHYTMYIGDQQRLEDVEADPNAEASFDTEVSIFHKFTVPEYMDLFRDMQEDCHEGALEFEIHLYNGTAHILWFDWDIPHIQKSFMWECPDDWSPYTSQLGPAAKILPQLLPNGDKPSPVEQVANVVDHLHDLPIHVPKLPDKWNLPWGPSG